MRLSLPSIPPKPAGSDRHAVFHSAATTTRTSALQRGPSRASSFPPSPPPPRPCHPQHHPERRWRLLRADLTTPRYTLYPPPSFPKQLFYLAKEYPDPVYPIHQKLHSCFLAHVGADEKKLEEGVRKAEYIKKGAFSSFSSRRRLIEVN
jgi:hypothetical protein